MSTQQEYLPTKSTELNHDEHGWPLTDFETELQLSVMYGVLVHARREREQAIAKNDAPPRPIVV